ncbi:cyclic-di-AMP-binding protein CbpB [Pueribacillus sp. YX66]|uniref:cyclic-di-AMP-binding protein CbpB n=1 Tax=Pueribacillus sp. YX66 TaxID=3229242 RepID=UPI00358D0C52
MHDFNEKKILELMIPSEKVAHVHMNNPLEHAMLVLIKSGYSAIPVVDTDFKLKGLISMSLILDSILGIERIEMERLENKVVEDVMNREVPSIHENESLLKGLKLSIDHTFLCVVNDEGIFTGIFTRRALLKQMNRYIHEMNRESVRPT